MNDEWLLLRLAFCAVGCWSVSRRGHQQQRCTTYRATVISLLSTRVLATIILMEPQTQGKAGRYCMIKQGQVYS